MRAGLSRWQPRPGSGLPEGLVLFDGVCVFCSRWVRFVIARDPAARFRFLPIQSAEGRAVAEGLGIAVDAPETNAVVLGGRALFKSDAALGVLGRLPRWGWVRACALTPRWLRDPIYDLVAGNRYRLFGRTDACMIPTPDMRRHMWRGPLPHA